MSAAAGPDAADHKGDATFGARRSGGAEQQSHNDKEQCGATHNLLLARRTTRADHQYTTLSRNWVLKL